MDLFESSNRRFQPLAERLRPETLADYVGQSHILGPDSVLAKAIAAGQLHSMIFWGPPGVGKTTLARLLAHEVDAEFVSLSAVMSGVKEIRQVVDSAKMRQQQGRQTILFVDEVHRFNKSQQDAFLPHVEAGTIVFVGATTENPSFELNKALLSRARVYRLTAHTDEDLRQLLNRACQQDDELASKQLSFSEQALASLIAWADGDARRLLTMLEVIADAGEQHIDSDNLLRLLPDRQALFDKHGDAFYEQISALHKAVRGSSPDGALYWFCRMLAGGCDPFYIARRLIRMASEDIGNADPRALTIAMDAWQAQERLGSPEGELSLAQAVLYLASAPKSNAVYKAFNEMKRIVAEHGGEPVPNHLCNAPTALMKEQGIGLDYRYAHDEPDAYAAGEVYLPERLQDLEVYQPVSRGLERKIADKLNYLKELDRQSSVKRYD
ncbi:replication-associated recombination protein A [Salinibius halmophilus]|uniref:replication-associated recombination protein A n=1 Tax=Salinibius halmophilus TaxID=1853216 RepID=UPI000E66BEFF|nr:replication-associated recombination protein A [Salinibius halmophilus]